MTEETEILRIMADGRERTVNDVANRLRSKDRKAIELRLRKLKFEGRLTSEYVGGDYRITAYRMAQVPA